MAFGPATRPVPALNLESNGTHGTYRSFEVAGQAVSARLGTMVAGQQLLLSGGHAAERALLAKKAAADAACADGAVLRSAPAALERLADAAVKLTQAAGRNRACRQRAAELDQLAEAYLQRTRRFRSATETLGPPPSAPQLSPPEYDAQALVQAKGLLADGLGVACHAVRTKAVEGAESIVSASRALRAHALADQGNVPTPTRANGGRRTRMEPCSAAAANLESLPGQVQGSAQAQLHATVQAVSARVGTAQRGRQLLSGGELAVELLLAKKAALDAAACDADLVNQVAQTAAAYAAAATALRDAAALPPQAGPAQDGLPALLEAYSQRAGLYASLRNALDQPVQAPTLAPEEWDAVLLLQAQETGRNAALQVARGAEVGLETARRGVGHGAAALRTAMASPRAGRAVCPAPSMGPAGLAELFTPRAAAAASVAADAGLLSPGAVAAAALPALAEAGGQAGLPTPRAGVRLRKMACC